MGKGGNRKKRNIGLIAGLLTILAEHQRKLKSINMYNGWPAKINFGFTGSLNFCRIKKLSYRKYTSYVCMAELSGDLATSKYKTYMAQRRSR